MRECARRTTHRLDFARRTRSAHASGPHAWESVRRRICQACSHSKHPPSGEGLLRSLQEEAGQMSSPSTERDSGIRSYNFVNELKRSVARLRVRCLTSQFTTSATRIRCGQSPAWSSAMSIRSTPRRRMCSAGHSYCMMQACRCPRIKAAWTKSRATRSGGIP